MDGRTARVVDAQAHLWMAVAPSPTTMDAAAAAAAGDAGRRQTAVAIQAGASRLQPVVR